MIRPILKFGAAPLQVRAVEVGELTADIRGALESMGSLFRSTGAVI